jgi:hypothetical protein
MKRVKWVLLVLFTLAAGLAAQESQSAGSEKAPPAAKALAAYKVEYILREMQGARAINSRQYSAIVEDGKRSEIKAGTRVPVATGNNQWQYIDIGVNLAFTVQATNTLIELNTTLEMSSVSSSDEGKAQWAQGGGPLIRQARTSFTTVVHEGQLTVIGSVDDVTSTNHYEIAVTVTKMK